MRILLDQGTPLPLKNWLRLHHVETARQRGWSDRCRSAARELMIAEKLGAKAVLHCVQDVLPSDQMHSISVKIPHGLKLRMERESSRRGVSKSRLIRDALENAFGQRKPMRGATVFDLTRDLCGSVRGGARDLSSNKKHLAGYGR